MTVESPAPARVVASRWRRLTQLPRYEEIHQRLTDGQSPEYVAKVIQEEMGYCKDVKQRSLADMLRLYRAEVVGVVLQEDNPKRDALQDGVKDKLKATVDLFERYNWLVNVQTYRIERLIAREALLPVLLPTVQQEIRVLRETMKDFADLQLEVGTLRRQPIALTADIRSVNMEVMMQADAAQRERVRQAVVRLLTLVKGTGGGNGNGALVVNEQQGGA